MRYECCQLNFVRTCTAPEIGTSNEMERWTQLLESRPISEKSFQYDRQPARIFHPSACTPLVNDSSPVEGSSNLNRNQLKYVTLAVSLLSAISIKAQQETANEKSISQPEA